MPLSRAPSVIIAGQSAVASSVTGTLVETTLATIVIPAGTIGPNGQVEIICGWSYPNSANAKTLQVKFGGTAYSYLVLATSAGFRSFTCLANRNNAASQVGISAANGFGTSSAAPVTSSVNTNGDVTILLTAQLANTGETITLEHYIVKVTPKA
jgi:hypothetical protein